MQLQLHIRKQEFKRASLSKSSEQKKVYGTVRDPLEANVPFR